ncbi:MAG: hypothetical protein OXG80_09710, partial [Chloroflexi bacterium]|nr:hypothetical protein [Chloroflexota bacterium]
MTLDIHNIVQGLAVSRPIFHSEADFHVALSETIKALGYETRLEFPSFRGESKRQDIWVSNAELLVELKFPTQKLEIESSGKSFSLKEHSAQDLGRYDFIKDIQRLERAVREGIYAKRGFAVMLTNDSLYWRPSPTRRRTGSDEFRIHEERHVTGPMEWGPTAGPGTRNGREEPIILTGSYK